MNEKLKRLGDDLEEIRMDASVYIDSWAIGEMRRLLKDLPPETTVQEIVDALGGYA